MTDPTISFVVPIYKIERIRSHFDELVQSLLTQTYPHTEIIFVNDASPDNSADIIQELADQHSHIRILTHSHNQGQGPARNTGATATTSDYIWFVDQDDVVAPNACQILADEIQALNHPDVVRFSYCSDIEELDTQSSMPSQYIVYEDYNKSRQHRTDINYFLLSHYVGIPASWFQIAKTELARNCKFPNFSHEDVVHTFAILMRANSLAYVSATLYFWRHHDLNAHKTRDFDKAVSGYIKALQATQEIAQQSADRLALQRYAIYYRLLQRKGCIKEIHYMRQFYQTSETLKADNLKKLGLQTCRAKLRFVRDAAHYILYWRHCELLNSWRKPKLSSYAYYYKMAAAFIRVAVINIPIIILFAFAPFTHCKLQSVYHGLRVARVSSDKKLP